MAYEMRPSFSSSMRSTAKGGSASAASDWGAQTTGLAVGASEKIVVTGCIFGPTDFGGGPIGKYGSVVVVELAPDGSHLWSRAFDGSGGCMGPSAAVDAAGNIVLAGTLPSTGDQLTLGTTTVTSPDMFVARLGPTGDVLWAKPIGDHAALA